MNAYKLSYHPTNKRYNNWTGYALIEEDLNKPINIYWINDATGEIQIGQGKGWNVVEWVKRYCPNGEQEIIPISEYLLALGIVKGTSLKELI